MSNNDIYKIMEDYANVGQGIINSKAEKWSGFKTLVLDDKVQECNDIISFYFKAKDNSKLPLHEAGQYLPLKIKTNNDKYKNEIRTYSLSMKPNEEVYRISVKKVPGGLISTYLHEQLNVGDEIEVMIPSGIFTLDKSNKNKPLILISVGIGITPLMSMLYEATSLGFTYITFIQAVQNSEIQPFGEDIEALKEIHPSIKNYVFYSQPLECDKEGVNYDVKGYVSAEWLKDNCSIDGNYYFCGPPIFMKILNKALLGLGVDKKNINYEFFGDPQDME